MASRVIQDDLTRTGLAVRWERVLTVIGGLVVVAALIVCVPPFLCMPPWNDVTLHDLAARSILRGGVHYRAIFDTNLPGIDWAMAAIRAGFGWSHEMLRAWDLVVIGLAVAMIAGWIRRATHSPLTMVWFLAAAALFYLLTSEFCHCQRDPWMLLPAVLAARMRLRQVERGLGSSPRRVSAAILEGILWGLAVWIKPHVLIPALGVWIASAIVLARPIGSRRLLGDLLGLVLGGLVVGVPGIVWIIATGAWPDFIDIFTRWNPEYTAHTWSELPRRLAAFHEFFPPWGWIHLLAIPYAAWALFHLRSAVPRGLLAAFYLAWLGQAVVLQRGFEYARVPDLFLALAVLATTRWKLGYMVLMTGFGIGGLVEANPDVLRLWPRCWTDGGTPEMRDRLGHYVNAHCGTKWTELTDVANFLRTVEPPIADRELNCWHDSTHPLYLMLDREPATRYMHYGTVFPIRSQTDRIRREVAESPQRFVVSDLRRMTYERSNAYAPGADGPLSLPAWFPVSQRDRYPWNQPIVFRSGRYLVHAITHQPTPEEINLPNWDDLDQLGPGLDPP